MNIQKRIFYKPAKKQPSLLYFLTFLEFWDRFSYYGIQALLILYVVKIFHYPDNLAYKLYGTFTALTFASPVLGGILADKYIGLKNGVFIGGLLIILGNILLISHNENYLFFGLSTLICGIGFFKSNSASLVGSLYEKIPNKREAGFSIFYLGMNAGALLGPIIYGFIAKTIGWHASFLVSIIGTSVALILFFYKNLAFRIKQDFRVQPFLLFLKEKLKTVTGIFIIISLFIPLTSELLQQANIFGSLLIILGMTIIYILIFIMVKSNVIDRKHIIALSILSFFCIFYFSCSLQTATTLTLFIEREVNKNIGSVQLPTMIFLSLQPLFIIICAPFMGILWKKLNNKKFFSSIAFKTALGLFFAAISFFIFGLAAYYPDKHHFRLMSLIIGNFTLGIGELCTLPILFSAVSAFSPKKWRSTMMSILFLSLAFSGYFAGWIAQITSNQTTIETYFRNVTHYFGVFIEIGLLALIISIVMIVLSPFINQLLVKHASH